MKNEESYVCIEGNGIRPSHKGIGWSVGGAMYTLNSTEIHCVCYSIGAFNSEGMLSSNPKAGIHETDVMRTLDSNGCGNPACYQGGVLIIEISEPGIPPMRLPDTDSGRRDLADPE